MKRILGAALALVMAVSMFTTSAFATNFSDTVNHPNADAAEIMDTLSIMKGYGNDVFGVSDPLTREQFCVMIVSALVDEEDVYISSEADSFVDVPVTSPYRAYIDTATREGYMNGYGNQMFGPKDPMTYIQVATVIMSALGYDNSDFSWPSGIVIQAEKLNLFDNTTFNSVNDTITRGHAAQMLVNAFDTRCVRKDGSGIYSYTNKDFLTLLGYTETTYDSVSGINAGHRYLAYKDIDTNKIYDTSIEVSTTTSIKFDNQGNAKYNGSVISILDYPLYIDGKKVDYDKKVDMIRDTTATAIIYNDNVIAVSYWTTARTYWSGDPNWNSDRTAQYNTIVNDKDYIPGISTVTFQDGLQSYKICNDYKIGVIASVGTSVITMTDGSMYTMTDSLSGVSNGDYVMLFFAADSTISYAQIIVDK